MKPKNIILIVLLFLSTISIQAQKTASIDFFNKFSNDDNVTTVFISKALLQMVPEIKADMGANINSLIGKLSQIEIYTTENKETAGLMKLESDKLIKNKTYESLMVVKEKGRNVNFLIQRNKDMIDELVMLVNESQNSVIIRIMGNFTMEDILKVVNDNDK